MTATSAPRNKLSGHKATRVAVKRRGTRATRIPEIVDCAIRVFSESGDAGFTQRRIASEAGLHLSTVQHYFESREALLKAAIEQSVFKHIHTVRAILSNRNSGPVERLTEFVQHSFEMLSGPENTTSPFALECWALAERHEWIHELMQRVSEEYHDLFAKLVGDINPNHSVSECRIRAAFLYSHWQGLIVFLRRTSFGTSSPEAIKKITIETWQTVARGEPAQGAQ
ncbi:TetR/AcrR family transcriptional regulator [Burkholderia sp. WSM2230]|uniref:TetR/AcrR family transcriptional regulator n=1 Tax=Burkholderia sp. WSM2230 TaxID=944435 RepID=UPI00040DDFFB|nr:TetR/AcrR family transcriptional regulator [Burkholderia sp. WSM2230]